MARGRRTFGCDLNSLAVFVTKAKTTLLTEDEKQTVRHWASNTISELSYHTVTDEVAELICPERTRNLHLPRARPAKKLIAQAILALKDFQSERAKEFARCVLLNAAHTARASQFRWKFLPSIVPHCDISGATHSQKLNMGAAGKVSGEQIYESRTEIFIEQ